MLDLTHMLGNHISIGIRIMRIARRKADETPDLINRMVNEILRKRDTAPKIIFILNSIAISRDKTDSEREIAGEVLIGVCRKMNYPNTLESISNDKTSHLETTRLGAWAAYVDLMVKKSLLNAEKKLRDRDLGTKERKYLGRALVTRYVAEKNVVKLAEIEYDWKYPIEARNKAREALIELRKEMAETNPVMAAHEKEPVEIRTSILQRITRPGPPARKRTTQKGIPLGKLRARR